MGHQGKSELFKGSGMIFLGKSSTMLLTARNDIRPKPWNQKPLTKGSVGLLNLGLLAS